MLVPLWRKWLKESVVSPEKLVDVGTTVAEMVKGGILSQEELVHVGTTVAEMVKGGCC
jgi:hypothetical protein